MQKKIISCFIFSIFIKKMFTLIIKNKHLIEIVFFFNLHFKIFIFSLFHTHKKSVFFSVKNLKIRIPLINQKNPFLTKTLQITARLHN